MTDGYGDFKSRSRELQLPADPGTTRYPGSRNLQSADEEFQRTPLGAPPANCDVRSVYDARPVNGFDFNIAVRVIESVGPVFNFDFQVDDGYVAVVREIHHWFEPSPVLTNRSDVLLTMFLNGSAQLRLVDIPVGVESDSLIKLFLIGDEFNTIRGRLVLPVALANAVDGWMIFYGNYLQKTSIPANQQIANCVGNFPARVVPPAAIEAPPASTPPAPVQPFPQELTPALQQLLRQQALAPTRGAIKLR